MQSFSVMDYLNIESANSFVLNMDIEELIGRIKEGDHVALETLYETYAPMMRNVCVNITNEDEDIVNDLVQMAFIRAYYSLFQLEILQSLENGWLQLLRMLLLNIWHRNERCHLFPFQVRWKKNWR